MSEWNATMYDNKHDFVAEYGKGLLEYIPQNEKQSIFPLLYSPKCLTLTKLIRAKKQLMTK